MPIRNYEITDEEGLRKAYPNLFKVVPDYKAIDGAIRSRFDLSDFLKPKGAIAAGAAPAVQPAPSAPEPKQEKPADDSQLNIEEVATAAAMAEGIAGTEQQNKVAALSTAPIDDGDNDFDQIPSWMKGNTDGQS